MHRKPANGIRKWAGIDTPGFIYFLHTKSFGSGVKIGFSQSPKSRMQHLKSELGLPLRLSGYVPGTKRHEKVLHAILSHRRMHGEWFNTAHSAPINAFIRDIAWGDISLASVCKRRKYWHEKLGGTKTFCLCGRIK